jgi:hypothetical protein
VIRRERKPHARRAGAARRRRRGSGRPASRPGGRSDRARRTRVGLATRHPTSVPLPRPALAYRWRVGNRRGAGRERFRPAPALLSTGAPSVRDAWYGAGRGRPPASGRSAPAAPRPPLRNDSRLRSVGIWKAPCVGIVPPDARNAPGGRAARSPPERQSTSPPARVLTPIGGRPTAGRTVPSAPRCRGCARRSPSELARARRARDRPARRAHRGGSSTDGASPAADTVRRSRSSGSRSVPAGRRRRARGGTPSGEAARVGGQVVEDPVDPRPGGRVRVSAHERERLRPRGRIRPRERRRHVGAVAGVFAGIVAPDANAVLVSSKAMTARSVPAAASATRSARGRRCRRMRSSGRAAAYVLPPAPPEPLIDRLPVDVREERLDVLGRSAGL